MQPCRSCSVPPPKSRDGTPLEYPGHWSCVRHFRQILPSSNYHQSSDVSPVKMPITLCETRFKTKEMKNFGSVWLTILSVENKTDWFGFALLSSVIEFDVQNSTSKWQTNPITRTEVFQGKLFSPTVSYKPRALIRNVKFLC